VYIADDFAARSPAGMPSGVDNGKECRCNRAVRNINLEFRLMMTGRDGSNYLPVVEKRERVKPYIEIIGAVMEYCSEADRNRTSAEPRLLEMLSN